MRLSCFPGDDRYDRYDVHVVRPKPTSSCMVASSSSSRRSSAARAASSGLAAETLNSASRTCGPRGVSRHACARADVQHQPSAISQHKVTSLHERAYAASSRTAAAADRKGACSIVRHASHVPHENDTCCRAAVPLGVLISRDQPMRPPHRLIGRRSLDDIRLHDLHTRVLPRCSDVPPAPLSAGPLRGLGWVTALARRVVRVIVIPMTDRLFAAVDHGCAAAISGRLQIRPGLLFLLIRRSEVHAAPR